MISHWDKTDLMPATVVLWRSDYVEHFPAIAAQFLNIDRDLKVGSEIFAIVLFKSFFTHF